MLVYTIGEVQFSLLNPRESDEGFTPGFVMKGALLPADLATQWVSKTLLEVD